MSNNDLKKLSRLQLLEMLLMQTQRVEELEAEIKEKDLLISEHQKQLEEMQKQFEGKKIMFSEAGTLAQAAMEINNVFRRADKAAAQYLENVKDFTEVVERHALERSLAAKKEAENIINQAKEERRHILQQATRGVNEKI